MLHPFVFPFPFHFTCLSLIEFYLNIYIHILYLPCQVLPTGSRHTHTYTLFDIVWPVCVSVSFNGVDMFSFFTMPEAYYECSDLSYRYNQPDTDTQTQIYIALSEVQRLWIFGAYFIIHHFVFFHFFFCCAECMMCLVYFLFIVPDVLSLGHRPPFGIGIVFISIFVCIVTFIRMVKFVNDVLTMGKLPIWKN